MLQALEGLVFAVRVSVLRAICVQPLEECAIKDKLSTVSIVKAVLHTCACTSKVEQDEIAEAYSAWIYEGISAPETHQLVLSICCEL